MCTTCNYKNFEKNDDTNRLESQLGFNGPIISCDPNGKNYKLSIKGVEKSDFTIYRCPTCGNKLY